MCEIYLKKSIKMSNKKTFSIRDMPMLVDKSRYDHHDKTWYVRLVHIAKRYIELVNNFFYLCLSRVESHPLFSYLYFYELKSKL